MKIGHWDGAVAAGSKRGVLEGSRRGAGSWGLSYRGGNAVALSSECRGSGRQGCPLAVPHSDLRLKLGPWALSFLDLICSLNFC